MQTAALFRRIVLPDEFVTLDEEGRRFGGDMRIGDLSGDGRVDFLVYKSLGGMKPCFLGAFDLDGVPMWSVGDPRLTVADADSDDLLHTSSPDRPGPVAIGDMDGDGRSEVVCFLVDLEVERTSKWDLGAVGLVLLDGATGQIKKQAAPQELRSCNALVDGERQVSNYVHQRLVIANFSGDAHTRDFVVKIGDTLLAYNCELELLWSYTNPWNHYPKHSAYIPAVGDLDGDGKDEVIGGHFALDHDGSVLWEGYLGDNMDSVVAVVWTASDHGAHQAALSAGGQILDGRGNSLLALGMEVVPHGQEIRCGHLVPGVPSPQLVIRYNGHTPDLLIVDHDGVVLTRFRVAESPNNTGLEIIRWNGEEGPDLIYSPAALYDGSGQMAVVFPDLPPPSGGKMGWYHCFPADVCGDEREEIVLYDPYRDDLYIYAAPPLEESPFHRYRHTARQYNARLID
jgi:hypothetical protein